MIEDLYFLLYALLALLLGGIIGYERETAGKGAGVRTNMLVCFAAYLFTHIGTLMTGDVSDILDEGIIQADPVRIIQAMVIGISFIGAGVIIHHTASDRIQGLTTAATLLVVAPIGVFVALGHFVPAIGVTFLTLLVLRGGLWLEAKYKQNS